MLSIDNFFTKAYIKSYRKQLGFYFLFINSQSNDKLNFNPNLSHDARINSLEYCFYFIVHYVYQYKEYVSLLISKIEILEWSIQSLWFQSHFNQKCKIPSCSKLGSKTIRHPKVKFHSILTRSFLFKKKKKNKNGIYY